MISVVLPMYNSQKYILKQLDSIRNQSVKVDEVILVDDASTDKTILIVQDYIKKYQLYSWKLYLHKSNKGFIESFTEAISYVQFDIIILCDHDDMWCQDKVKIIKETFEGNLNVKALATSFYIIDENDNIKIKRNRWTRSNNNLIRRRVKRNSLNKMSIYDVAVYNISPGCTCAFNSEIKGEFFKFKGKLPHDWKINIIAACLDGLYYLDVKTTRYRIYDKNTIGLGHQSDIVKRKKIVKMDAEQKKEILKIVEAYKGLDCEYSLYMKKIIAIFLERNELLDSRKIISKGIPTILHSTKKGHLLESVVFDIWTIVLDAFIYKIGR